MTAKREKFEKWHKETYGTPGCENRWDGWQAAMRQAVPEGFVQMPIKPTWEIICAMYKAPRTADDVYRAIISVAPSAGSNG